MTTRYPHAAQEAALVWLICQVRVAGSRQQQSLHRPCCVGAAGDPAAVRALVNRYSPGVLGLATRMLADRAEAEDVTNIAQEMPDSAKGQHHD